MFEFFFKYPEALFAQGNVILTLDWPLWRLYVALGCISLLLLAVLIVYRKTYRVWQLMIIGLLQILVAAVVLVMIWQPALVTEQLRAGENTVAVLLDVSESMSYGDATQTRMQQARAADGELAELEQEFTVQRFVFGGGAVSVPSFAELPEPAAETRLGESLLNVLNLARSTPLGAVVLLSDGADSGLGVDLDVLSEIASFGVPVHTIGLGREVIPEDLELADVSIPARVLPGSSLAAQVSIRHDVAGEARVKVYEGDNFLASEDVVLAEGNQVTTAWIELTAAEPGQRILSFTLDRMQDEQNTENNSRVRVLEIPDETFRILYIEGEPRWEYKFMRRALAEDNGVELVTLLRVSPNKFYRQGIESEEQLSEGFPSDAATLFEYDALIIGSIEAAMFTPEQQGLIRDFVNLRGGSLMMLAGLNGLAEGGWDKSSVSEILPVDLDSPGVGFVRERAKAVPTPAGSLSPLLRFSDDDRENRQLWEELPEIADYQGVGALKPAAVSLLEASVTGTAMPLLVTQPYGRGHSYVLATGGTWRWQMSLPVADQRHETFWRQLARGLVSSSPGRFQLSANSEANRISISANIRDDEFEPMRDVEVTAVVSPESGEPVNVVLQNSGDQPGILQGEFSTEQSGLYFIEAISRQGEESIHTSRMTISNDADNSEHFSYRQNRALLERLSLETGGQYWAVDQLDEIPAAIRSSQSGIREQKLHPLWDAPVVFLLLLMLKSFEWLLRRRWKTI